MRNKWLTIVASVVLCGLIGVRAANADVLEDVKKKGVLVVGSKGDYRPFG